MISSGHGYGRPSASKIPLPSGMNGPVQPPSPGTSADADVAETASSDRTAKICCFMVLPFSIEGATPVVPGPSSQCQVKRLLTYFGQQTLTLMHWFSLSAYAAVEATIGVKNVVITSAMILVFFMFSPLWFNPIAALSAETLSGD